MHHQGLKDKAGELILGYRVCAMTWTLDERRRGSNADAGSWLERAVSCRIKKKVSNERRRLVDCSGPFQFRFPLTVAAWSEESALIHVPDTAKSVQSSQDWRVDSKVDKIQQGNVTEGESAGKLR
jgi:hypothetical protein